VAEVFDYAETKADADELIAEFGQAGTLSRPTSTGPTYNPTAGAPASYPVTFVVTDFDVREIDGARIKATDKKVLLANGALAIEPATSDNLLIGGVSHSIEDVQPLAPGGVTVFWTLQVRR
jgi:hypothetical protein